MIRKTALAASLASGSNPSIHREILLFPAGEM